MSASNWCKCCILRRFVRSGDMSINNKWVMKSHWKAMLRCGDIQGQVKGTTSWKSRCCRGSSNVRSRKSIAYVVWSMCARVTRTRNICFTMTWNFHVCAGAKFLRYTTNFERNIQIMCFINVLTTHLFTNHMLKSAKIHAQRHGQCQL